MNELKQFAAIAFVKDTRIASLRNLLAMLRERTDAEAPEYISTDLCCLADKEILEFFGKAKIEDRSRWRRRRHHSNPSRRLARRDSRDFEGDEQKESPRGELFSRILESGRAV